MTFLPISLGLVLCISLFFVCIHLLHHELCTFLKWLYGKPSSWKSFERGERIVFKPEKEAKKSKAGKAIELEDTQRVKKSRRKCSHTFFFLSSPCWLCILFLYDTAAAAQERISQRTQDASLFYLFIFLVEPSQGWQKPWAQWTRGGEGYHKIIKSSCKVSPVLRNLWQKKQQKNVKRVARKYEVKM